MVSNSASGDVFEDHRNVPRECDVVRKRIKQAKNLNLTAIWLKQGSSYKFPCPLQFHDHEIAECPDFLTLNPKDPWFKIPRGRICFTCLKPKGANGVCKFRQCTEVKSVPQALVCTACAPWTAAKGWVALNILMCRKSEHGRD